MNTIKYSTQHLTCYYATSLLNQPHYQIFENGKNDKPMVIYVNKDDVKLADEFPIVEKEYKYFDEMCEIIQFLNRMSK